MGGPLDRRRRPVGEPDRWVPGHPARVPTCPTPIASASAVARLAPGPVPLAVGGTRVDDLYGDALVAAAEGRAWLHGCRIDVQRSRTSIWRPFSPRRAKTAASCGLGEGPSWCGRRSSCQRGARHGPAGGAPNGVRSPRSREVIAAQPRRAVTLGSQPAAAPGNRGEDPPAMLARADTRSLGSSSNSWRHLSRLADRP